MQKPAWKPVFETDEVFAPEIVLEIYKKSKIPNFKVKKIEADLKNITESLNAINLIYHTFKHRNEEPKPNAIRGELEDIARKSKKYRDFLESISYPAQRFLGLNQNFFESLQKNVLGLQINAEKAIPSIKTKPGAPKKSILSTIIELSKVYEGTTGKEAGRSTTKGRRGGPFLRFAKLCLDRMDPNGPKGDETISKAIQKAQPLSKKYFKKTRVTS